MDGWTIGWLGWGAAFLVIEGSALLLGPQGSTLSEHVWSWFRVKDRRPTALTWLLRVPLWGFLLWLLLHLGFGVWPT